MNRTQLQNSFQNYFNSLGYNIDWEKLHLPIELHFVKKNDYVFQQGDLANRLYFLHSGIVRYVSVSEEGKEFTQAFVKAPRLIGSTQSMVTQSKALFSIQALEDCMVVSYPWEAFFEQMRQDQAFLLCYIHFLEKLFIHKEERENAFARHSAERRYLDFCVSYPELKDKIPLQQVASYIGITPIALSRIRKKLNQITPNSTKRSCK